MQISGDGYWIEFMGGITNGSTSNRSSRSQIRSLADERRKKVVLPNSVEKDSDAAESEGVW